MSRLIVIAGATASGKTDLAIQLAGHFNTHIVSADSRQCYRELSVGTAVPTPEELQKIPHHFIRSHTIHQKMTAGSYASEARTLITQLFEEHEVVVLCGGTGLYIKALLEGLDEFPQATSEITDRISRIKQTGGLEGLRQALESTDPVRFKQIDTNNPARVIRALEIVFSGNKPFSELAGERRGINPDWAVERYCIDLPREVLYDRISLRTDEMMKRGLLQEVKSLLPFQHLSTLSTVGYTELFQFLNAEITLTEAVEKIKQHTRNYAKRQLTWFRNQGDYRFMSPEAILRSAVSGI
ncbi:MAG: tRNA (adenosine(37)-N6)-dimethylallyltransferase MiaA [Bacteroidota bacterium]